MMQDSSSSSPRTTLIISQYYCINIKKVFSESRFTHVFAPKMFRPQSLDHITTCCSHQCWASRRVTVACHRLDYSGRLLTRPVRTDSIASSRTVPRSCPPNSVSAAIVSTPSACRCHSKMLKLKFTVMWTWISTICILVRFSTPGKIRSGLSCQVYTRKPARIHAESSAISNNRHVEQSQRRLFGRKTTPLN